MRSVGENTMNFMHVLVASTAAFLILGSGSAKAGQTINEDSVITCVVDKWDEKEPEKGHKLVDYAARCIEVPDDHAARSRRTASANTSTCPTEAGRAPAPAPGTSRVATTSATRGRRARTSGVHVYRD
jgi:hypothetical protein